jgi:4-aminobutyrate aminotransferase-like enzyme
MWLRSSKHTIRESERLFQRFLRFMPVLTVTHDEIDELIARLEASLR